MEHNERKCKHCIAITSSSGVPGTYVCGLTGEKVSPMDEHCSGDRLLEIEAAAIRISDLCKDIRRNRMQKLLGKVIADPAALLEKKRRKKPADRTIADEMDRIGRSLLEII